MVGHDSQLVSKVRIVWLPSYARMRATPPCCQAFGPKGATAGALHW